MICPKCEHEASEHDADVMPGVCPACGIAYAKFIEARAIAAAKAARAAQDAKLAAEQKQADALRAADAPLHEFVDEPAQSIFSKLLYYLGFMPSDRPESSFWGHVVIYLLFVAWGFTFIIHGVDWLSIGSSFLHNINLPFHEYGHIMFSPFGTFWMFLGGSLFQVLLPLLPLGYFVVWQRDNFAASLMLWWSGQNLIDVSPYIADAPLRAIPLITGDDNTHDWWNLLSMSGSLDSAEALATTCFGLGVAVILLSNFWGAALLVIEFRGRTGLD